MSQYVLQIINATKRLIKSYKVTPDCPIRETVPEGRTQVVIQDEEKFNEVVEVYNKYTLRAKFSLDGPDITWIIDD